MINQWMIDTLALNGYACRFVPYNDGTWAIIVSRDGEEVYRTDGVSREHVARRAYHAVIDPVPDHVTFKDKTIRERAEGAQRSVHRLLVTWGRVAE